MINNKYGLLMEVFVLFKYHLQLSINILDISYSILLKSLSGKFVNEKLSKLKL